jgi:hypothetical protein
MFSGSRVRLQRLLCLVVILPVIGLPMRAQLANAVPVLNQPVIPAAVAPGQASLTLTVNGTGFVPSSVVNWNGGPRPTTYISSSRLTAAISASDIETPGTAAIFYSGCACLQAGNHRQARRFFGRALRRWPWSGRCALLAMAACMTPKQLSAAKRLYRRMVSAPEPEHANRAG